LLLIFDNYDSFTYNLCDYFKQLGQELLVIRNDEKTLEEIEELTFDGIVLSPGPGIPATSGILMKVIDRWHTRVPILGICLGHQALGTYFGVPLIKAPYPMHGKVSGITADEHPMWNDLPPQFEVCRYHSLVLDFGLIREDTNQGDTMPFSLTITARSIDDSTIMAMAHQNLPIWGIQFHPEAILTQYGIQILNNWLKAFILHKQ
jgi:anthranilate synthase/aminodeoxychorismate synthase-like glutamine amidotransferase